MESDVQEYFCSQDVVGELRNIGIKELNVVGNPTVNMVFWIGSQSRERGHQWAKSVKYKQNV